MKYIEADKLLAEIERRMSENCELAENAKAFGHRAVEDNDILALIESLQQAQQPDAEEITPIMAEYVADVFSRKEHLDNISYGYCMEISAAFRRYAERAKQKQSEVDL